MLWAAVAKFCSISRMKVSAAFSRESCRRLGRICGISPRKRSPRDAACPRTPTKLRKGTSRSSPPPTCSTTSKSQTGASGCVRKASCASRETSRSKSKKLSVRPLCAGCRPVQPECPWHRLEVEADLVHRGQQRPDGSAGAATLSGKANGSNYPRCR